MRIDDFDWDEHNREHATRHGVSEEEIEVVLLSEAGRTIFARNRAVEHQVRYFAYGRTFGGRLVTVVFEDLGGGMARPISARDMTKGERTKYVR